MDEVWRALAMQGFFGFAGLGACEFASILDREGVPESVRARYEVDEARYVIAVALRYGEGEYPAPDWAGDGSCLRIARFARANWYEECSRRLEAAVKSAIAAVRADGRDLPDSRKWKRLVNSGLPEKPVAVASGLGIMGRNGIVIARGSHATENPRSGAGYSSGVVLGLLLCPVEISPCPVPQIPPSKAFDPCRSCRRCIDACPSGALSSTETPVPDQEKGSCAASIIHGARYERLKCIQHWTALPGEVPVDLARVWGGRLYGCDSCLEACPWFRTDPEAVTEYGRLGPCLPASFFLRSSDMQIRERLSGSALGMRWMSIEGFRRSAALDAAQSGTWPPG
jgi:epoxyqueuosine reductase